MQRSLESWLEERHNCESKYLDYVTSLACDWLEEAGDARVEALRWMHQHTHVPRYYHSFRGHEVTCWDWVVRSAYHDNEERSYLLQHEVAKDVFLCLEGWDKGRLIDSSSGRYEAERFSSSYREYPTRVAAELALLDAYVKFTGAKL